MSADSPSDSPGSSPRGEGGSASEPEGEAAKRAGPEDGRPSSGANRTEAKRTESDRAEADEAGDEVSKAVVLRGTSVAPGLVLSHVHRKDYDLSKASAERVPLDGVDRELNRFRKALDDSRLQLGDLKARLEGRVQAEDARILDTHVAYLKDSVFLADVENLILNEQMRLEAAIAKVINDFDRIFRLVESESLQQTAVDLRDVAIRVLRNLEGAGDGEQPPREYVLVARELSIVDMFNLANEHVQGIVTEEGGLTSHAAIFARSMRIPTMTGVEGLLATVQEGDFVILDATEGVLRVNPDDLVRQQFAEASADTDPLDGESEAPDWAVQPLHTRDGTKVVVRSMCGNLPEVEAAAQLGIKGVGLYRTELLYLIDKDPPSREALVKHYASVVERAGDGPVTFRLLNTDSTLEIKYLHGQREPNPQLGRAGVRILLRKEHILRRQLQAILLAAAGAEVRIVVPVVTDSADLRRLKEILFEERIELRKAGGKYVEQVELGAVIETPASLLGMRDLAREADFLMVNLDSLVQYLLAADRENTELSAMSATLHPFVLRALSKLCKICGEQSRELSVFGVMAFAPGNLPMLLGCGLRDFSIPPSAMREFMTALVTLDLRAARREVRTAERASCQEETQSFMRGYQHGWARP